MSRMEIVVPSRFADRDLDLCIEQLEKARGDLDVDVTVVAGEPYRAPARPWLRVIESPGDDVFALRARGVAAAKAPIVAITEDHCQVSPTWCQAFLDAFEDPHVVMAKGPVANGARDDLSSWVSYYSNFAFHLADWPGGPVADTGASGASTAWRREHGPDSGDAASFYADFMRGARERDVAFVPRAYVIHWQALRPRKMFRMQYHNARACSAYVARRVEARRGAVSDFMRCFGGGLIRTARAWTTVARHPHHRGRAWLSLPLWAVLSVVIGWGQWRGVRAGPGESPQHVA